MPVRVPQRTKYLRVQMEDKPVSKHPSTPSLHGQHLCPHTDPFLSLCPSSADNTLNPAILLLAWTSFLFRIVLSLARASDPLDKAKHREPGTSSVQSHGVHNPDHQYLGSCKEQAERV